MTSFGEGFVSGFMNMQKLKMAKQEQARQYQAWNLQMQKAGIELNLMRQEEAFQTGKLKAAEEGGMNGVIDYMMKSRPEEGLKLQKSVQDYHNSLQQGQYYQAMTQGKQEENFQNSITAAGNMYGQLHELYQKDPALVESAYQNNFDLIKQLDKNAPDKYNDERALMAMGLAVPQSMRFQAQQNALKAQTEDGQDIQDLQLFIQQGNTLGVKAKEMKIQSNVDKYMKAQNEVLEQNVKIAKTQEERVNVLRKEYDSRLKNYDEMAVAYRKMEGLTSSDDIYTNPQKQDALVNQHARFNSPGVVTELNEEAAARSPLLAKLWQYKKQLDTGAPLPKEAIDGIASAMRAQWKGVQPYIKSQNDYYKGLAQQYGIPEDQVVNPNKYTDISQSVEKNDTIEVIKQTHPDFSVQKFVDAQIQNNPEIKEYIDAHPEYVNTLLKKYSEQLKDKK